MFTLNGEDVTFVCLFLGGELLDLLETQHLLQLLLLNCCFHFYIKIKYKVKGG